MRDSFEENELEPAVGIGDRDPTLNVEDVAA